MKQPQDRAFQADRSSVLDDPRASSVAPSFSPAAPSSAQADARAVLEQLRQGAAHPVLPTHRTAPRRLPTLPGWNTPLLPRRWWGHALICLLIVALIATSHFGGLNGYVEQTTAQAASADAEALSANVGVRQPWAMPAAAWDAGVEPDAMDGQGMTINDPALVDAPMMLSAEFDGAPESLIPHAPSAADMWAGTHEVAAGETLGGIAATYDVSALSLAWSNNLSLDGLAIGQQLRIPASSGVPYTIAPDDSVATIAAQHGVEPATINAYPANQLNSGRSLELGEEIFIPNGVLAVGEGELSSDDEAEIAAMAAAATGRVLDEQTNVRRGPGTTYAKLFKVGKDANVKLLAQHQGWYNVRTSVGEEGWIEGSLLATLPDIGDYVPQSKDIPLLPTATPTETPEPTERPTNRPTERPTKKPTTKPTQRPALAPTTKPIIPTAKPAPTKAIIKPTAKPVQPTAKPVEPTAKPIKPTAKPVEPTAKPVKPTAKPAPKPTAKATQAPTTSKRWVWPTYGNVTSRFGWRTVPFRSFHNGIDIANKKWTPIVAARAGRVVAAGWCSGYGYCVIMNHGDGFRTEYGHMASKPPVRVGARVNAGQLIGYVGSTYDKRGGGYSSGNHLHFTVRVNGKAVNPLKYLP